jgi:dihydrofolate reductase
MRKIVAGLFITLDGVVEAPETWTGPHFTDEIGQHIGAMTAAGDTMLLGRVTYQELAATFAGQSGATADQMNNTPKIVVSTTLDTADWQNSSLIKSNVVREIITLKQRPGKNIIITGSPSLVRSLLRDGLLDELDLMLFPIVLGAGTRLFGGDGDQILLRLAETTAFSTGVLKLSYQPAGVGQAVDD